MRKFEAVIFDCDGVLMDSIILSMQINIGIFARYGYYLTIDEYQKQYLELGSLLFAKKLKEEYGIEFKNIQDERWSLLKESFKQNLKPIPHIKETLDILKRENIAIGVASNSWVERLEYSLKLIDLYDVFEGHVYSSDLVVNAKPAPDLFIYAAEKMRVSPKDCLVVEDEVGGTQGALAAGMSVYGFYGASHMNSQIAQKLKEAGAERAFANMEELLDLMDAARE